MTTQFRPFYDPSTKPQWAQLTRLGGDRVAVLFKELRAALGRIEGIVERMHFAGTEDGWVVRYSLGSSELFTARISPGRLEVKLAPDIAGGETFLNTQQAVLASNDMPHNLQSGSPARTWLRDRRMVRAFASVVAAKSKLLMKAGR